MQVIFKKSIEQIFDGLFYLPGNITAIDFCCTVYPEQSEGTLYIQKSFSSRHNNFLHFYSSLKANCCKAAFLAGIHEAIKAITITVNATSKKSENTIFTGK